MGNTSKKNTKNILNFFNEKLEIDDAFLAPSKLIEILFDREKREKLFDETREFFQGDLSYDWFHEYFQEEHADRKNKKQDFTPQSISRLMCEITGVQNGSNFYECACGTGGIVIEVWNHNRLKYMPWEYRPNEVFFELEELSERTLPFLLFNLMVRGINAVVIHGNALTREAYGVFFIQNFENNSLGYSDLNVFPYTEQTEKIFNVKFTKKPYPDHVERSHFDEVLKYMEQEVKGEA